MTVALSGNNIISNKLCDVAGVPKLVPMDSDVLQSARNIGIAMGD